MNSLDRTSTVSQEESGFLFQRSRSVHKNKLCMYDLTRYWMTPRRKKWVARVKQKYAGR
jgi:hypothetical protein